MCARYLCTVLALCSPPAAMLHSTGRLPTHPATHAYQPGHTTTHTAACMPPTCALHSIPHAVKQQGRRCLAVAWAGGVHHGALHTPRAQCGSSLSTQCCITALLPRKTTPSRRTHWHWHWHWHRWYRLPHPMSQLRHAAVLAHATGGPHPTVATLPVTLVHCRRAVHAVAPRGKASGVARLPHAPPDPWPPRCHCHG